MKMNSWQDIVSEKMQQQYMGSMNRMSKQVTNSWVEAIQDKKLIVALAEQLKEEELDVLLYLLRSPIVQPIEQDILLERLKKNTRLSGQQSLHSLLSLAELGMIQLRNDPWRGMLWNMPFPIFHHWRSVLLHNQLVCHTLQESVTSHSYYEEHMQRTIGKQLLLLLFQMSQLDLSYTNKGSLRKQTKTKLMRCCAQLQEAIASHIPFTYEVNKEEIALTLLLELALALQLIEDRISGISICYAQLEKWLLLHENEREKLHQQWLCEYLLALGGSVSNSLVISDLLIQPVNEWIKVQATDELYHWIGIMRAFGWISYASFERSGNKELHVLVRELASFSAYQFNVQSNGEIIILSHCSFRQLWLLMHFSECVQEQEISIYKISIVQLQQIHLAGYSLASGMQWLKESSEHELPLYVQLLEHSLDQKSASSFVKPHSNIRMQVKHDEMDEKLQLTSLQSWGRWIKPSLQNWELPLLDEEERKLLREEITYFNGTSSWVVEHRNYHYSTSKELIQFAIEKQLALSIKQDNKELKFNPERLVQIGNDWMVEGVYNKQSSDSLQQWRLNDWEGIKLYFAT